MRHVASYPQIKNLGIYDRLIFPQVPFFIQYAETVLLRSVKDPADFKSPEKKVLIMCWFLKHFCRYKKYIREKKKSSKQINPSIKMFIAHAVTWTFMRTPLWFFSPIEKQMQSQRSIIWHEWTCTPLLLSRSFLQVVKAKTTQDTAKQ